ncbi:fibrous sheath-interacting protein 1 isoform X2 [Gouania willdenowi]|uniref:fibrous sheath-interacting protein 1 isoform X2 n=1 Tax=Gouania willdenowi TaxID=441366 RepID=UPI0010563510|nr:fibrous sheath-interacting protein 1 isoform X2 [Gouania willdenowi]
MEIIRGSLDNIARPASGERTCAASTRPDRISPTQQFALLVLTNDAPQQNHSSSEEQMVLPLKSSADSSKDQNPIKSKEENNEDVKLQRAIEEMRRLDEVLFAQTCKEKEIQCQRKELRAKLWHGLLHNKKEGRSESAHEALNTRLFLELEPPTEDEDDITLLFETKDPKVQIDRCSPNMMHGGKTSNNLTESFKSSSGDQCTGLCRSSERMDEQKDYITPDSELLGEEEDHMILTKAEQERLAELLQEIEEVKEDSISDFDSEQNQCVGYSKIAHEAFNPRLFTALGASTAEEDEDITLLFETELPEGQHDNYNVCTENGRRRSDSLTESYEFSCEEVGGPFRLSKSNDKQKNFVRRNIELVSEQGGQVSLTKAEQKRLTELLQEIDEEEEEGDAFNEDTTWAVSVLSGHGYIPEPSDLEKLIDIDSKIRLFLSDEEFDSLQHSFTNLSLSRVCRQQNCSSRYASRKQIQPSCDSTTNL